MTDEIRKFQQYSADRGLPIPEVVPDGVIHRLHCEGDKVGTKNLWYVFFSYPIAAGAVGSWKTGESHKWCSRNTEQMTPEEREALKRQYREAQQQRKQNAAKRQRTAADKARFIVSKSVPVSQGHEYLIKKRIKPHKLKAWKGSILAELRDVEGVLHSVQFIKADGEKYFLSGGRIKGVFHTFGEIDPEGTVIIAEGVSTANTVFEWKKHATLAAMNAGNLEAVAVEIFKKYPKVSILIAADNDRFNPGGNVGKLKAEAAARRVNGRVLLPEFPENSTGSDWNDLHCEQGYL